MQLNKILVVIDPKRMEQPALKRATWFASKSKAILELLLVEYNSSFEGFSLFSNDGEQKTGSMNKGSLLSDKKEWLETIAQPIRDEGFSVNTMVKWSKQSYKEILSYAAEVKADMIFKSAYSESMLKRLFITNSCWQLIRNSTLPLWLVQHEKWAGNTICAALDPTHMSDKPAILDNQLISITERLSQTLNVPANYLHSFAALPRPQLFGGDQSKAYEKYLANFTKEHTEAFNGLLSRYPTIKKDQQFLVKGFAEEIIPQFVEDHNIGLMVMGAVARGSLDNLLIGHTAERVLEVIECDLLVVHP